MAGYAPPSGAAKCIIPFGSSGLFTTAANWCALGYQLQVDGDAVLESRRQMLLNGYTLTIKEMHLNTNLGAGLVCTIRRNGAATAATITSTAANVDDSLLNQTIVLAAGANNKLNIEWKGVAATGEASGYLVCELS